MELVAWIIGIAAVTFFYLSSYQKKKNNKPNLSDFITALVTAADEGERAYSAQMSLMSLVPNARGIAFARFVTTLFPIAAYAVADTNESLLPAYKQASLTGGAVWNLASGVALKPVVERGLEFDKDAVEEDQLFALNQFIDLFNAYDSHFKPGRAFEQLAPIWQKALATDNDLPSEMEGLIDLQSIQIVTAGIQLFGQWYEALTGVRVSS